MKHLKYIAIIVIVFIADQLSKWSVMEHVIKPLFADTMDNATATPPTSLGFFDWITSTPAILPYAELKIAALLNIVMVWNRGISFGLFNNNVDYAPYFLIALSAVIALWFTVMLFKTQSKTQRLSMALIIGGALGNIIDRVRFGAVIDFIDVHAYGYHWPAFNVADSAIVVGVFILAFNMVFFEKTVQTAKKSV